MAKNLENTSYRKLDVDAFDPEKFVDCEDAETPGIGPDERLVNQLLQSAKLQEALKASLSNPPLKCKNQVYFELKFDTFFSALNVLFCD